jgi:hypothetical protein
MTAAKPNIIAAYVHCARCMQENLRPNLAAGITHNGDHVQFWCETHNCQVGIPLPLRYRIENITCAECSEPIGHDQVRAMTIGQLLDLCDVLTTENWETIEKVLVVILERASIFYDECDDLVGRYALDLGLSVAKADGIDKITAAKMVHNIGLLACAMWNIGIDREGNSDWRPDTVARLEVIMETGAPAPSDEASNDQAR